MFGKFLFISVLVPYFPRPGKQKNQHSSTFSQKLLKRCGIRIYKRFVDAYLLSLELVWGEVMKFLADFGPTSTLSSSGKSTKSACYDILIEIDKMLWYPDM